ncbi:LPXTG cell wall anchor domain-containing protein [Streptomyces sp. NPDC059991]|uniref:LPXTG cell wall anchor domain-containing protein n=1 Tax=unclassified Streptomyces TaxID=2593676 RepID=UPI00369522E5
MNTTKHHRRAFARGAAATGLLAALAVPALAGTAHADGGTQPRHLAAGGAVPPSAGPSAPPSAEPRRPAPGKTPASPDQQPSAMPSAPGSRSEPAPSAPPTKAPAKAPADAVPSAVPSPSTRQDELAHTGSSKTNTVLGAGAGALIAAGAGTVYAVRRRQNH